MLKALTVPLLLCFPLMGCGMTSTVDTMHDGTYLVVATNTPVFEDPSDASDTANRRAQEFCAAKGLHAVVVSSKDGRADVQSSGFSGPSGGRGIFAAGSTSLNFKCS